jgi:hypothetical protein
MIVYELVCFHSCIRGSSRRFWNRNRVPMTIIIVLLSFFRQMLMPSSLVGYIVSLFFGLAIWFTSCEIVCHAVGLSWLIISLLFFGLGPVLVVFGLIVSHAAWDLFGPQLLLLLSVLAFRCNSTGMLDRTQKSGDREEC